MFVLQTVANLAGKLAEFTYTFSLTSCICLFVFKLLKNRVGHLLCCSEVKFGQSMTPFTHTQEGEQGDKRGHKPD